MPPGEDEADRLPCGLHSARNCRTNSKPPSKLKVDLEEANEDTSVGAGQYDRVMSPNLIPESSDSDLGAGAQLRLASLAPQFEADRHLLYYGLLLRALDADGTYNVALTGAYGTGKSSVLGRLYDEREDEVIRLSLSTIAPDRARAADDAGFDAESRTNQIQKEIVKQLLYRLAPDEVPRSRFRRLSAPNHRKEWKFAAVWGGLAFLLLFGVGLLQVFIESLLDQGWRQAIAYVLLAGVCLAAAKGVVRLVRGRMLASAALKAGPTTVTLSKEEAAPDTYFDKYLDEIVYFFEASSARVVVIEDIDRFEHIQVFDTLRALNSLLNSSGQLYRRRIVFVYAIRDSVFNQIGQTKPESDKDEGPSLTANNDRAKDTLERASRTKFFDVIVPVVPFVSADNARDVMSEAMESPDFTINPALIRVAARHVADMRLIHNIRNEFEVYRNRLVVPDHRMPTINDDLVFAIVLFKNTHVADFERLRHQDSSLDTLYRKWRDLVRTNLANLTRRRIELHQSRELEQTADSRAAELGRLLLDLRETLAAAARVPVQLAGVATEGNVEDRETWEEIASGEAQNMAVNPGHRDTRTLSFTTDHLAKLLGVSLDPTDWKCADLSEIAGDLDKAEEQIQFLRHHTWETLCERPDLTLVPASFEAGAGPDAAKEDAPNTPASFDQLVRSTLESDLARDLVRHGFLTSHFALYASSYYGTHLGPDAMEYIRRNIEPGVPDPTYALDAEAVTQILREQGASQNDGADLFTDPSVFNISIVDHLLEKRTKAAATVARTLARLGEQERSFVDTYVAQSEHGAELLAVMAPTWPGVLIYAADEAPVDSTTRLRLLDAVLRALPHDRYDVNAGLRQFIETKYHSLEAVTNPDTAERADIVLGVVGASQAVLSLLGPLDDRAREAAVEKRLYPVTEQNLHDLSPGNSISLDVLRGHDRRVYEYVIERLPDYLDAFGESPSTAYTVQDANRFEGIVAEVAAAADAALLGRIIAKADPTCAIPALAKVPAAAWSFLASGDRTDPTFENVKHYIDEFDGFDHDLGSLLSGRRQITEVEDAPDDERLEVAVVILAARAEIPDVATRVELAGSLNPGEIPATRLTPEAGDLIARLLKAGMLADDEAAFDARLMVDWSTYEAAIQASSAFRTVVSPALLKSSHLRDLLGSALIAREVKDAVLMRLTEYLADATPAETTSVAQVLNEHQWSVGYEGFVALVQAGASTEEVVELIARRGEELEIEDLKALLRAMGEPYLLVADRGGGRPRFPLDEAHDKILTRLVDDTISKVARKDFKRHGEQFVAHLKQPTS